MATLGRSGDVALASRFAAALAAELRAVGVTLDYAPVLDIHTNPKNPVIGDRALAEDARSCGAARAPRLFAALQDNGVAACGKHFPGHGDTSVDSHLELPIVEHPPDRHPPGRMGPVPRGDRRGGRLHHDRARAGAVARRGAAGDAVTPIVDGLLRDELGFEGVILSDDLEMQALAQTHTVADAAVKAIAAGCDGVLVCRNLGITDYTRDIDVQAQALEALVHAVEDGRITYTRVEDALFRQRRAKERFLAAPVSTAPASLRQVVGCDAHRRIAEEMARFL